MQFMYEIYLWFACFLFIAMVRWSDLWGTNKDRHGSKVWGEYEMYHFFSYLGLSVFSIGSGNFYLIWLLVKLVLIKISLFSDFWTSESGVFFKFCEHVDHRYYFFLIVLLCLWSMKMGNSRFSFWRLVVCLGSSMLPHCAVVVVISVEVGTWIVR